MAYKNVEVKCGGYEPLRVKDAYIQTFATSSTPNYDGEQYFDLTKPHDMITVGQSDTKTITFGSTIQISIDNTINTTYIQIFVNGTRVDYHTLAQKRTEFYIVVVGDSDNQNGLGSVILETSNYNWCSRKCANSTVNAAIFGLLNPSAWENYPITGMSTGLFTGNMDYPSWSSDYSNFVISLTPAQVAAMSTPSSPYEYAILGDLTTGLIMQRNGSSTSTFVRFLLRYNGVNCLRGWGTNGTYFMSDSDGHYVTFFFAIDDVSERGTYSCVFTENNQQSFNEYTWNYCANSHDAYLAIKILVPPIPIYNWYSLTSISGNGLTVPLVELASDAINDGDPVSDATTSAFDVLPSSDNNVRSLVNLTLEPISTDNAVTITYSIPALKDDSYSSVKVYAKIGEAPKCDETDDIVEDVDPTINEISLENLEFETEYFFCIQSISNNGLKLSSNVESISTGSTDYKTKRFLSNGDEYRHPALSSFKAYYPSNDNGIKFKFTYYNEVTAPASYWGYTDGNANMRFIIPMKRYKATKMYIKLNGYSGNSTWRYGSVHFAKNTDPSKYSPPSWFKFDFAMYESSDNSKGHLGPGIVGTYPSFEEQIVEIDISSMATNQEFYFGFSKCNWGTLIKDIYFDDDVELCYDMLPTVKTLLDYDTGYVNSLMNSRTTVTANSKSSEWVLSNNKLVNPNTTDKVYDNCIIDANFIRHHASKLFIEVEVSPNAISQSFRDASIVLCIPGIFNINGYSTQSDWSNTVDVTHNMSTYNFKVSNKYIRKLPVILNANTSKTLVEIDLKSFVIDAPFQILFDVRYTLMTITKIYFDDDVILLNTRAQLPENDYAEPC